MRNFYVYVAGLALLAAPGFLFAQSDNGGWRRADEPQRQLTIQPGTIISVRVDQPLSSDQNQPGDGFSATLARPIVVDGVVVAERGQALIGRVSEAQKAGRVRGVSRLAVELTELTLADGRQMPMQTQLANQTGPTTVGRDAEAVASATAMGAAIGAVADWGRGAAIGAGVGAAASTIGVLLTRGHETVIYPESVLTFRLETPVTVSTERAPMAFRPVSRDDYEPPGELRSRPPAPPRYYPPPYIYGPGYWYPYGWYPYGPGFYIGYGYYGRGHYRGYRR